MFLVASILFLLAVPSSAHAYLDPGAGSLLIQFILGGVAGILVVGKLYFSKLKALFGIKDKAENSASEV